MKLYCWFLKAAKAVATICKPYGTKIIFPIIECILLLTPVQSKCSTRKKFFLQNYVYVELFKNPPKKFFRSFSLKTNKVFPSLIIFAHEHENKLRVSSCHFKPNNVYNA